MTGGAAWVVGWIDQSWLQPSHFCLWCEGLTVAATSTCQKTCPQAGPQRVVTDVTGHVCVGAETQKTPAAATGEQE